MTPCNETSLRQNFFSQLTEIDWNKLIESDSIKDQSIRFQSYSKEADKIVSLFKCPNCNKFDTLRKNGQAGTSYRLKCNLKDCGRTTSYPTLKRELYELALLYWTEKVKIEDLFLEPESHCGKRKQSPSLNEKKKKVVMSTPLKMKEEESDRLIAKAMKSPLLKDQEYELELDQENPFKGGDEGLKLLLENNQLKAELLIIKEENKKLISRIERLEKSISANDINKNNVPSYAEIASTNWTTTKKKGSISYNSHIKDSNLSNITLANRFTNLEIKDDHFTQEQIDRAFNGKSPFQPTKVDPVIIKGGPIGLIRKIITKELKFSSYKIMNISFIGQSLCEFLVEKQSAELFRKKLKDRFPKIDIITDDPLNTILSIDKEKTDEEKKKTIAGQYLKRLERIEKGPICNPVTRWVKKEKKRATEIIQGQGQGKNANSEKAKGIFIKDFMNFDLEEKSEHA